jgi:hypothetical protein
MKRIFFDKTMVLNVIMVGLLDLLMVISSIAQGWGDNGWKDQNHDNIIQQEKSALGNMQIQTYSGTFSSDMNKNLISKGEIKSADIDIGLYNSSCGDFEVKLKPIVNIIDNYITNIQFTVKWKSNTVNLINFYSDYDVELQGQISVANDTNFAIFASITPYPVDWIEGSEYTILGFSHDQSGTGVTDFLIDKSQWSIMNNGVYYVELLGLDHTGIIFHNDTNTSLGICGDMDIKVFLEGPYNSVNGQLKTSLNSSGKLPLIQPYNNLPWNYNGTESVVEMPVNIVDWILVELRDAPDASSATIATRIARQAALLRNDGKIVGLDGSSHLKFDNSVIQNLFVVIWHRNHLEILTAAHLTPSTTDYYSFDFTIAASQAFESGQINLGGSSYGMISGDANADGIINNTDRTQVWMSQVGISGYETSDFNMDGQVDNSDKNDLWLKNFSQISHVPD